MTATGITALDEATFGNALAQASQPLLVDFWAEDCAPCRALIPILEQIVAEHADRLHVAGVRLDDNPALARRHQITALPTLILFTAGCEVARITTVTTKGQLLNEIEAALPRP